MTLDRIKEIIGLVVFTLLTFTISLSFNDDSGLTYSLFPIFAFWARQGRIWFGKEEAKRRKTREEWREDHARMDARDAQRQMNRYQNMYSNLSMNNPYLNMEKTMEDLTINQQKVALERQTFQQSQRNVLDTMRPTVGGSGVASLTQALVRQGQRAEQQFASNVAKQEAENRILALRQREAVEKLEREGSRIPMGFKAQQIGAMMGMTQQQYAADKELEQQYYGTMMRQETARISSNLGMFNTMLGGMGG